MGAFPFFILFGHNGGGDPIRRCKKCGEPITITGKFFDRHPVLFGLSPVFAAIMIFIPLMSFLSWTVDRDYPEQSGGVENVDTYAHYVRYELRGINSTLHHLW